MPEYKDAERIFATIKEVYANHEKLHVGLLFSKNRLAKLKRYQKGGAKEELEYLRWYIELSEILNFNAEDAKKLKRDIEIVNDIAHSSYNITKRVKLINKKRASKASKSYLFWDIENFSNIASIFSDVIEPYNIKDSDIYMAANPDSLYIKRSEWEANLYDYGKSLESFNFTKCDHGKNVADDILLNQCKKMRLKGCNIFLLTFDRELKERFVEVCDRSVNLYVLGK